MNTPRTQTPNTSSANLTISCDDCSLRRSTACDDCVVTFVLDTEQRLTDDEALVLDLEQERVVRWMSRAGLVPDLRFDQTG